MTEEQTKYDSKRGSMNKENMIVRLDKCIAALEWSDDDKDIDGDINLRNLAQVTGEYIGMHHAMIRNIAEVLKVVVEEINNDRRTDKV